MRIPDALAPLFDDGILDEVLRPLMSGKEAHVYMVVAGGKPCVAKVYKEAQNRTFKQRAEYTEGRKVRNTRDQRAMDKRSRHGRAQDEAAWRSTEVDVIQRLYAAGVRVPVPLHFFEGVLLMELVTDAHGQPAPRLADMGFEPAAARTMYDRLIREVTKMLCAGVVHGDLSDFNVLAGADGPVLIDFPQAVDPAHNANARKLLLRDVDNLHRFLTRFAPEAPRLPYAEEMWELFERNVLTPETQLHGRYRAPQGRARTREVLELIDEANYDERKRRAALGLRGGPPAQGSARTPSPAQPGRTPHAVPDQRAQRRGPNPPGHAPQRRAPSSDHARENPRPQGSAAGQTPVERQGPRTEHVPTRNRREGGDGGRKVRRQVEVIVVRKP